MVLAAVRLCMAAGIESALALPAPRGRAVSMAQRVHRVERMNCPFHSRAYYFEGLSIDPVTQLDDLAPGSLMPDERSSLAASHRVGKGEISSGTWAASPHTCKAAPYPVDEFCFILEGEVHISWEGRVDVFGPGEAFWIDKDTVLEWKQTGTVRKFYVIHAEDEEEQGKTGQITSKL